MTSPSRSTRTAAILDWVRGIAALMVVLGHIRALFFHSFEDSAAKGIVSKGLHFLFGFGHQAVIVFFVLSGFFVGGSVIRQVKDGRWSLKNYLIVRGSRLYIVAIPALLIGAAIDLYGIHSTGAPIYSGGTGFQGVQPNNVAATLTPVTFLGNVGFLQTLKPVFAPGVPVFGTNVPSWSLAYEAWYYLAFPALLFIRKLWPVLALVAIGCVLGVQASIYFGIWFMGAVVAWLPETSFGRSKLFLVGSSLLSLVLLAAARQHLIHNDYAADFGCAVACTLALYAILSLPSRPVGTGGRVGEHAAGFSYTLYLVHMPLLVFACAKIIGNGPVWDLTAASSIKLLAIAIGVMAYAAVLWWCFERNTDKLRKWLIGSGKTVSSER